VGKAQHLLAKPLLTRARFAVLLFVIFAFISLVVVVVFIVILFLFSF
jgi:hypothetical protein